MSKVLVLTANYEPINVINVEKAFKLWAKGKVVVIEESDKYFRTVSVALRVPLVVKLINFVAYNRFTTARLTRQNIFLRDALTCQYCGDKLTPQIAEIEHVIPRSQGGKTAWNNVVTACRPCNRKKDDRTPAQAGMKLIRQPKQPDAFHIVLKFKRVDRFPDEWRAYLKHIIKEN